MADRILTWHRPSGAGSGRMGPAYFIEAEYTPTAVRIHAERGPQNSDAEFNIFDDGETIFANRGEDTKDSFGNVISTTSEFTAVLPAGDFEEVIAEDFNNNVIAVGSWMTCELVKASDGLNYTVHLELRKSTEDEEEDE